MRNDERKNKRTTNKGKKKQRKKPTQRIKKTTFLGHNDLRRRNTVPTFKVVILHLGNSASNKNIFSKSHFLSTRNNVLALFSCQSSAIVLSEIILPKTIDKEKSPGKCYTSALQSWFLWINHPPSLRKWYCLTWVTLSIPLSSGFFFMGIVHKSWQNKQVPALAVGFLKGCCIWVCFVMNSTFLQEFLYSDL